MTDGPSLSLKISCLPLARKSWYSRIACPLDHVAPSADDADDDDLAIAIVFIVVAVDDVVKCWIEKEAV